MRAIRTSIVIAIVASLALAAGADARSFFGIAPQTPLSDADTERMRRGGLDVVRVPVVWASVQPSPASGYDWSVLDQQVAVTARARLDLLPFLYGTPRWLASRQTNLPIAGRQRRAWIAFLRAAVRRYGTNGEFWREHGRGTPDFVPRRPIKRWQVWNEANFFYFTTPASPGRYARLLRASYRAIHGTDPRAEIVLGGLFGNPKERPPRAMDASRFLQGLYRVRGVKRLFDGVALHPYAADQDRLRRLVNGLRQVILRNRDRGAELYVTELGWGSQRSRNVSFEVGRRAQARELRLAYRYLIRNRGRLNLEQVHWFSWKDVRGDCSFCDSVGLFHEGPGFRPKPAWHALVRIAR